jgi:hypothetical protein
MNELFIQLFLCVAVVVLFYGLALIAGMAFTRGQNYINSLKNSKL